MISDSIPADLRADLGPLNTAEDAKRWCGVMGRKVAAGDVHPDGAGLEALNVLRAWRREREGEGGPGG